MSIATRSRRSRRKAFSRASARTREGSLSTERVEPAPQTAGSERRGRRGQSAGWRTIPPPSPQPHAGTSSVAPGIRPAIRHPVSPQHWRNLFEQGENR